MQRAVLDTIESDTVVEAKEPKHRQEETHSHPNAPAETEGIVVIIIIPAVSCLEAGQAVDRAAGIRSERIAHFQGILIKDSKELACLLLVGIDFWI